MFKHAFAAFIALSGLNGVAAAQTAAPSQSQTPAEAVEAKCAAPVIAGEAIDLKPVPGSDLVTVPVAVNGTPKQFLLDIDTNPDEVSEAAVADLHLPGVDRSTSSNAMAGLNTPYQFRATFMDVKSAAASNGQGYQTYVRVASLGVAGATAQNLQLPVANDREMGKSEPYDGLFTGNLFPQYDINFDFGGKKLSFMTATSCTDPNQVAYWPHTVVATVPITISGGKMHVPVSIGGKTVDAVLDTGLARTVMRRDLAESIGLKSDDMTPDGDLRDGLGMQVYQHTFPQLSFSGITATNVPVRIQTNSMVHPINRAPTLGSRAQFASDPATSLPDLAIGMDVLHQLHLYAAFGENKLYVTPAG